MNILVFGATGPTGRQLIKQALTRGHRVTAFARRPEALLDQRLHVVTGDVLRDEAKIDEAMHGQDAVVSALGRRASFSSDRLISRAMKSIAAAMQRAGVRRIVLMSAFGVGESARDAPLVPRIMYCVLLRDIFADKLAAEEQLRSTGLDWMIVYPVLLTDGPLTGRYRVGERLELHGLPKISRADVAHFMLGEIEKPAWVRKVAVISY
ncbi:MAG TPA: SDR family oxidoreductase [Burkholderiales bacterium]|nr:SDR family oxidoreductase [Burkholderiales bacterium]